MDFNSLDLSENQRILLQLGLTLYWPDYDPHQPPTSKISNQKLKNISPQSGNHISKNVLNLNSETISKLPEPIRLKLIPSLRPAHFLWTYPQFLEDLIHKDLTPRKKLVKNIVHNLNSKLNWPRGSITFWPLFVPGEEKLLPDKALFTYGLKHINPLHILCFGEKTFKVIFPDLEFTIGKFNYNNIIVHAFPDLDEMLPDNRELKNKVWDMMKKINY